MTTRTRLLAVTHDFSTSGAPTWLFDLTSALASRFDFTVIGPSDGPLREQFTERGIATHVVPDILNNPKRAQELVASFDALMPNTLLTFVSVLGAAAAPKPIIWTIHETSDFKGLFDANSPWTRLALACATETVTTCNYSANMYRTWWDRTYTIIHPGVAAWEGESKPVASTGPLHCLVLGTIHPRKGQDIAVEAFESLGDDFWLDIAGQSVDLEFERALRARTLGRPVTWHGRLPNGMECKALQNADIVVVPSREELTSLVVAEAQMCGRCVVAANVGGIPEVICNGHAGLLFGTTPAELASTLKSLAENREKISVIGKNAHEYAHEHHTVPVMAEKYARFIEGVLQRTNEQKATRQAQVAAAVSAAAPPA
jgi:glycosyltransferase involved in cell wall biosynthesis